MSNENEKPDDAGKPDAPHNPPVKAEAAALPVQWVRVTHHTPDHIAARYLYAGYGSNLSLAQMVRRCPNADIVGPGVLRGSRLVFAYHLGIVQDEQATTLMGCYRLNAADVAALDRYEALGRLYDRFLVTVEVNGVAIRCFTYVKRDNEPEAPSDRYYETCLQGFNDWNFDARRLRHARDYARKHGKRRAYGHHANGNGFPTAWHNWYATNRGKLGSLPNVPTMDGSHEPIASGSGESYTSHVTGRKIHRVQQRYAERKRYEDMRPDEIRKAIQTPPATNDDPTRTGFHVGSDGQTAFTNPRTGERWAKGKNGVWHRVKGE